MKTFYIFWIGLLLIVIVMFEFPKFYKRLDKIIELQVEINNSLKARLTNEPIKRED